MRLAWNGTFLKMSSLFSPLLLLISSIFLLYKYDENTLGDTALYKTGGDLIAHGIDPYVSVGLRSGPIGSTFIYLLSMLVPDNTESYFFQAINMIGILGATYVLSRLLHLEKYYFVGSIFLVWTGSFREMLANHQTNGIVLGCYAISIHIAIYAKQKLYLSTFISAFFASISLDLKPHISLFLTLATMTLLRLWKIMRGILLITVVLQIVLASVTKSNLLRSWFENLSQINRESGTKWADISNLWPLVSRIFGNEVFFYNLALASTLALMLFVLYNAVKGKVLITLLLASLAPIVTVYCHLFDLVIFIGISIFLVMKYVHYPTAIPFLSLALIPKEITTFSNSVFLLVMLIAYVVLQESKKNIESWKLFSLMNVFEGIVFAVSTYLVNSFLPLDDHLLQSLVITETAAFAAFISLIQLRKCEENRSVSGVQAI